MREGGVGKEMTGSGNGSEGRCRHLNYLQQRQWNDRLSQKLSILKGLNLEPLSKKNPKCSDSWHQRL